MGDVLDGLLPIFLICLGMAVVVYSVTLLRKSVRKQADAIAYVDDSIKRQERAIVIAERNIEISEQILSELKELNRKSRQTL